MEWAALRNELTQNAFNLCNEGKDTAISVHVQLYMLGSLSGFFPETV